MVASEWTDYGRFPQIPTIRLSGILKAKRVFARYGNLLMAGGQARQAFCCH